MSNLDFIYNRHSVRKFKDAPVPKEDIKEIIKAATHAPSGKNAQNWHFVVINDKEKIEEVAKIVERKHDHIVEKVNDPERTAKFSKFLKYFTVFRKAPTLILVYAGPYPASGIDLLEDSGASQEEINNLIKRSPGIQNIGSAVQTLNLAATAMGYGTCWMTGSNFAAQDIEKYIGFEKEGYYLACMVPIGTPEGDAMSPPRKPVEEVMTFMD